jgi:hypothetical protein
MNSEHKQSWLHPPRFQFPRASAKMASTGLTHVTIYSQLMIETSPGHRSLSTVALVARENGLNRFASSVSTSRRPPPANTMTRDWELMK